jgi:hypothetical protein
MKQHLKPGDFRADLPANEIEQLNQVEGRAAMNDQIGLEMSWGMQMQARGFDPNMMFESRFDPTAYGLKSDRSFLYGIRDAPPRPTRLVTRPRAEGTAILTPADLQADLSESNIADMVKDEAQWAFDDAHDRPLSAEEIAYLAQPTIRYPVGSERWLYKKPSSIPERNDVIDRLAGRGLLVELMDEFVDASGPVFAWRVVKAPNRPTRSSIGRLFALTDFGRQELAKGVGT